MQPRFAERRRSFLFVVLLALFSASSAEASRCVGVFFRGFNAPVGTSGMDNLRAHLVAVHGGNPLRPFSTDVFNWTDQQQAFDFVDSFSDIGCFILAGHSFGANAAVEFTTNFLEPAGIPVDVLVQFDSVGANDGVLPGSVVQGFNYHQVSTGFLEPEGESTVVGSTNVYVEMDYGVSDSEITHTEIDCPLFERDSAQFAALFGAQPDLYERVDGDVAPLFEVEFVPSMGMLGGTTLVLTLLACVAMGARGSTSRTYSEPS